MILSDVMRHVAVEVLDAPELLIESKLLLAAQDFYTSGRAMPWVCDPVMLLPNVRHYDLAVQFGYGIAGIERATADGRVLDPVVFRDLDRVGDWERHTSTTPWQFFRHGQAGIGIYPLIPAVADGLEHKLTVRVSVIPESMTAAIDARDLEALTCGALARLLEMNGKPWSNQALAAMYWQRFSDARSSACNAAMKGDLNTELWVIPRPLA